MGSKARVAAPAPAGQFRWSGLSAYVDRVLARLAAVPGEAELGELQRSLDATNRRLGVVMSVKGVAAAQLTPTTRALRGWVGFLSDLENLRGYVQSVRAGTATIEVAARQAPGGRGGRARWEPPVRLYLRPMRGMYKARQRDRGIEISLPTPAMCFGADDFAAAGRAIFVREPAARRHLLARMSAEDFTAIAAELDVLGGPVDEARGAAYDLGESFDRVNERYFHGTVKRPKLFWSRALTRRKFGHYDWVGDAIMLSRTLDSPAVPQYAVDFVMYHEVLHKAHGLRWSGGRKYAHTAAFYRDERKFEQYEAAEAVLDRLANAPTGRRRA